MKRAIINYLLLSALLAVGLTSCIKDNIEFPKPGKGNETTVTFALEVPSPSRPATRALSDADEKTISSIDVLVFEKNGGKYRYSVPGVVQGDGRTFTANLVTGECDLVILANATQIIKDNFEDGRVTNSMSRAEFMSKLTAKVESTYGNKWDTEVLKYQTLPLWGERNNIDIRHDMPPLTSANNNAIKLVRMHSRVDVLVNKSEQSKFKLTSIHVYNYHEQGRLAPLPANIGSDYIATDASEVGTPHDPNAVPHKYLDYSGSDITINSAEEYMGSERGIYLFEAAKGSADKANLTKNTCLVIGGIYDSDGDGDFSNERESFYRLDFINKTSKKHMPLKRNFKYICSIVRVSGNGYPSSEDAFNSLPTNIEAEILEWNSGDMGDVVFDGQNYLSVNKGEFLLSRDKRVAGDSDSELIIMTDYTHSDANKTGWQITSIADENGEISPIDGWLRIEDSEKKGDPNVKSSVSLLLTENKTGTNRKGLITITAGRLNYTVVVEQSIEFKAGLKLFVWESDNWVEYNDAKLTFIQDDYKTQAEPQKFKAVWEPKDATVNLNLSKGIGDKNGIGWGDNGPLNGISGNEIASATGEYEFEVTPDVMANYKRGDFTENADLFTLSMTVHNKQFERKVTMEHFVKDVFIDSKRSYLMDGNEHSITVYANVPWGLDLIKNISTGVGTPNVQVIGNWDKVNDSNNERTQMGSGGYNLPYGKQFVIKTVDDMTDIPKIHLGNAEFEVISTEVGATLKYDKKVLYASGIKQNGREANCYVLDPTQKVGLLIPVRAANGHMADIYKTVGSMNVNLYIPDNTGFPKTAISDDMEFGAQLVWADEKASNGTGLGDDGLLSHVVPVLDGENGYVLVLPGNLKTANKKVGNAVVAVTHPERKVNNESEILWSWHIWITDGMKFEVEEEDVDKSIHYTRIMPGHNGEGPVSKYWLDRNLGATSNTPGQASAFGNHYQWGRKDPFPSSATLTPSTGAERQLYDANNPITGSANHGSVTQSTSTTTVSTSITTPLTFYGGIDWLSSQNDNLWGVDKNEIDKGKSIFDPCPAGYRVPVRDASKGWEDSENYKYWGNELSVKNSWWDSTNKGMNWPSTLYKGGWYPAAGNRGVSGLNNTGGFSYSWSSSPTGTTSSWQLHIDSVTLRPSRDNYRFFGFPVRCVLIRVYNT